MRRAVVGMVAHVDAGKTTLAEAMLFHAGVIRRLGRVDHGDAFLDTDGMERRRGITIYAKQANLTFHDTQLTLLDTPGHADLVAEAERVMRALDYAIFVIGANDGVAGHAMTLWKMLGRYHIPVFVFVNKTDLVDMTHDELLVGLRSRLGDGCMDVAKLGTEEGWEALALSDERALEEYLATRTLSMDTVRALIARRKAFPCFFGSALHDEGVEGLLSGVADLLMGKDWPQDFGARVFKVSHGARGERISWLKVTGGTLSAKARLDGLTPGRGGVWAEKVDQLRVYNGDRFEVVDDVDAGAVCAATGLSHVFPGDGLGCEAEADAPLMIPVLSYGVRSRDSDAHAVYAALRELSDEDPLLSVIWQEEAQETQLRLMGSVQLEVVRDVLKDRFGLDVAFGPGTILYRETIAEPVVGIGHFEPLRHYAEVHLLLEPTERGSGVSFGTVCDEDALDRNWQRLILTNAMEREHLGVLTGSPITDIRITLLAGRAHAKHTEGGDFRQATYRAVRNALMRVKGVLLEPQYRFELEVPAERVGRALSDVSRMGAHFDAPVVSGEVATISGIVPVSEVGDYAIEVSSYTAGTGRLLCSFAGYGICHDADRVVAERGYDPRADVAHTPDSVFCSHGAGFSVAWDEVSAFAHVHPDPSQRRPWRAADATFFSSR